MSMEYSTRPRLIEWRVFQIDDVLVVVFFGIDFAVGFADEFLVSATDAEFVSASEGFSFFDADLCDFRERGHGE